MYQDISFRLKKLDRQITDISYMLIEAEGEDYERLSDRLERLESEKDELNILLNDMEYLQEYGD